MRRGSASDAALRASGRASAVAARARVTSWSPCRKPIWSSVAAVSSGSSSRASSPCSAARKFGSSTTRESRASTASASKPISRIAGDPASLRGDMGGRSTSILDERVDVELLVLLDERLALALDQAQKRPGHLRVELGARVLVDLRHDRLERERLAVGSVA